MKCLLFNSPIYRFSSEISEDYLPPLGLGYLATQLNMSGISTEIIDCVKKRLAKKEIFEILMLQQPNFIGINLFTQNYEIVKEIVEKCPIKTTIIIGGQTLKSISESVFSWNVNNMLIIIIGESELILPEICNATCDEKPLKKIENKSIYRVDKKSKYYPNDLNALQLDRTLFANYTITNHYGQKEAAITTSRGCMYNCAFCGGAHNLNKDVSIRYRCTCSIKNELHAILSADPTITSIRVLDDLFLRDESSIKNVQVLFEEFENLTWRGMAHILTFSKKLEMLATLKQSGCQEMFIGIESGSERIRKKINKPGTIEQIIEVVSAILENGIDVKCYFMYGFPSETADDANKTFLLAQRLKEISRTSKGNLRLSVFQFRPYHGTQLYNEIIESGRSIPAISSNEDLNTIDGRSQFNFQSGNYSDIEYGALNNYILNTQKLMEG